MKARLWIFLVAILTLVTSCGKTRIQIETTAELPLPPGVTYPDTDTSGNMESEPEEDFYHVTLISENDEGLYYDGSIDDLIQFNRTEPSRSNRLNVLTDDYAIVDVSEGEAEYYRYEIYAGEVIKTSGFWQGGKPEILNMGGSLIRLVLPDSEGNVEVQYISQEGNYFSRNIKYSGLFTDYYNPYLGQLFAVYPAFDDHQIPIIYVEDVLTADLMTVRPDVDFYNPKYTSFTINKGSCLVLEYIDKTGKAIIEDIPIQFYDYIYIEGQASQFGHWYELRDEQVEIDKVSYNIPIRWSYQEFAPERDQVGIREGERELIGFALEIKYDWETQTYFAPEYCFDPYDIKYFTLTNHSITAAFEEHIKFSDRGYTDANVGINERVARISDSGTRIIVRDYSYGSLKEYGNDGIHPTITVYFNTDFEMGEIRDLTFDWGILD